ncbi:MAG: glycosyl transferase, partial [Pseudomonadales bacterium]
MATYLFAHSYRVLALHFHWMDHPDERSAHLTPTPTAAGLSFVIVFFLALSWMFSQGGIATDILYACLGPLFIALVGFRDDLKSLPVIVRASAHFLAGAWCIYWIGFPELNIQGVMFDLGFAGLVFGMIALVWLLNVYNFMDGIDGLAAGEAAFVCLGVLLVGSWQIAEGWNSIVLILLGVSLGFLIINWPTARVFMGDIG